MANTQKNGVRYPKEVSIPCKQFYTIGTRRLKDSVFQKDSIEVVGIVINEGEKPSFLVDMGKFRQETVVLLSIISLTSSSSMIHLEEVFLKIRIVHRGLSTY